MFFLVCASLCFLSCFVCFWVFLGNMWYVVGGYVVLVVFGGFGVS